MFGLKTTETQLIDDDRHRSGEGEIRTEETPVYIVQVCGQKLRLRHRRALFVGQKFGHAMPVQTRLDVTS
jgi:hypothetical protein